MAEIVRRRSWGGVLPLGRHVSISGSSFIQCASASIAPPHPGGAKCYPGAEVQGRTGSRTTLHYADNLDNPANKAFLAAFKKRVGQEGNIYAVQGFDTAALLDIGLGATGGDWAARDAVITAMEGAKIDSPRGPLSFSRAHNPIQNIYL